jgi:hypothetical protein
MNEEWFPGYMEKKINSQWFSKAKGELRKISSVKNLA